MAHRSTYEWLLGPLLLGLGTGALRAEEIAPFRLTGVDGYATLRYLQDDYASDSGAGMNSRQQQGDLRTEVVLNGHGYVYHPNLLSLDLGGGPILQRQRYSGDSGDASYTGSQYNLSLRAALLKNKPYRGNLYYDHLNPSQSIAPGQVINQNNRHYGGDFSLLSPVTPVPMNVAYSHSESKGSGADRILDDNTEQFTLRANRSFGAIGDTQWQYQAIRQTSLSGSNLLPIQVSRNNSQGFNMDSRLQLGREHDVDLTQSFALNRRSYDAGAISVPAQSDMRLMLDLRHRPNPQWQEYLTADGSRNRQGELRTNRQSLAGGVFYHPDPQLELAAGMRGENDNNDNFSSRTRSANGSINYQHALGPGTLQAGYGATADWHSQLAGSTTTPVIGEAVTLSGIQYVALSHDHISAGSVVVSNATRTQVFAENIDYLITVVGAQTRIQRLAGGAILDGEQVLVDYSYDLGGSYTYRQVDQNFNLGWTYGRYLNLTLRHLDSRPVLLSGQPSFPFNTVSSTVWGARGEVPVPSLGWSVGGGYEREDHRETLAPFQRTSSDAYVQNDDPLPSFGNLRLGVRRTRVDYGNPLQNVDFTGYDLRYGARPGFGWDLSATVNYEVDRGGLLPRKRFDSALNSQWRKRKLTMNFSLSRSRETQGSVQRTRSLWQWLLRRDF